MVDSDTLAEHIATLMEQDMDPANSWQVSLDGKKLRWTGRRDGQLQAYSSEREAGLGRKLTVFFSSFFPIEEQP